MDLIYSFGKITMDYFLKVQVDYRIDSLIDYWDYHISNTENFVRLSLTVDDDFS